MDSYQRKLCWTAGRLVAALLILGVVLIYRGHAARQIEFQQNQFADERRAAEEKTRQERLAREEQTRREQAQLEQARRESQLLNQVRLEEARRREEAERRHMQAEEALRRLMAEKVIQAKSAQKQSSEAAKEKPHQYPYRPLQVKVAKVDIQVPQMRHADERTMLHDARRRQVARSHKAVTEQANTALQRIESFAIVEGQLIIRFGLDTESFPSISQVSFGSQWAWMGPRLCVRLLDRNGQYLSHFITQERFTTLSQWAGQKGIVVLEQGSLKVLKKYNVQCNLLKAKGNELSYPVVLRDLRDVQIVEIGFDYVPYEGWYAPFSESELRRFR